uniref:Heparan-sulfate 6-O-sulfotransferase n=1 Tax=Macrostomum lignano TaxID=282301 RepID=A0A1I8I7P5_9PLAT
SFVAIAPAAPPVVHWLSAPSLAASQAAGSHCGPLPSPPCWRSCCWPAPRSEGRCRRPSSWNPPAPSNPLTCSTLAAMSSCCCTCRRPAARTSTASSAASAASAVRAARKWRCSCRNSRGDLWIVSRYSTGWLCGLHADFAALSACVPGQLAALDSDFERPRRLRYVTMLRRPADRFLSEWQHARRGATWRKSQPTCRGRRPPPCRTGDGAWRGVSLAEFAACRANPALNRQARMLANASGLPCRAVFANGNRTADLLLASALHNLVGMAAFGLTEWQ